MTSTARSGARNDSSAGVPLSAMLAHPTWHDVTLLAGPEDSRTVQHPLAAQDLSHPLPEDPVGRLLVLLGGADRGDWRLDALLRRAHGAGVAALLVPGVTALRMSSTLLAERLRLPVLGSPDPLAAYLALERMTAEPGLLRAESALRTAQVCARADETVDALLTDLGALLHRPVALLTADARHLAGDQATVAPAEQDMVARQLTGPPLPRPLDLPSGARLLTHPVGTERVPPRLAARLPARLTPEADAVAAALEVASGAVRERLALRRLDLERSARHRTSLLGELLRPAGGEIPDAVRRHAVEFGWRLDGWHTGIRIGTGPDVDVAGLRAEVTDAFAAERLGAQVVEQGDGWSAWTSTDQEPSTSDIERHAAAVRRVQRRLPEVLHAYVGWAAPIRGPPASPAAWARRPTPHGSRRAGRRAAASSTSTASASPSFSSPGPARTPSSPRPAPCWNRWPASPATWCAPSPRISTRSPPPPRPRRSSACTATRSRRASPAYSSS